MKLVRQLSLSLIVVVIASTISLGWIINQIYIHTSAPISAKQEYQAYLVFTRALANAFDASENKANVLAQWNRQNNLRLSLLPRELFPVPPQLVADFEAGEPLVLESDSGAAAYYLLTSSNDILSISLPATDTNPERNRLELILTLSFYGGVTTIILIWIWPLIHHLGKLRDTASKFGQGNLDARVRSHRFSYIKDIESEFNNMADRIQSLIGDNKLLSRAVSHDLKTPLARLRFGLDALTETENDALKAKYAGRINKDLEEMESLIETLLQYARLDESRVKLNTESLSLSTLVESLIDAYDQIAIDLHFIDNIQAGKSRIWGDKRYLAMLINNVLSNAIRHAESNVRVSLNLNRKKLLLIIEDDGEGIPDNEREHAVKPFWRGSQAREKKGHGMGLAIVARIAEWHGAQLTIQKSQALGGAEITMTFALEE